MLKFVKNTLCVSLLFISIIAKAESIVKLATGNEYPPFSDEKLKEGGLFTQIVKTVLKSANINSTIEFVPWKRAETLTETGEFMAAFPYMKTVEREKNYQFSDPVYAIEAKIIVNKNSSIKFDKIGEIEGLKGKTFCKPKGYGLEKFIEELVNKKYITQTRTPADMKGCILLLDRNEVDFVPDAPVITYQIMSEAKVPKENFKVLAPTIQETDLRLMITKKKTDVQGNNTVEFVKKFNDSLAKLKSDGTIEKLANNY